MAIIKYIKLVYSKIFMNLQQAEARVDTLFDIIKTTGKRINCADDSVYRYVTENLIGVMNAWVSSAKNGTPFLEGDYNEGRAALVNYLSLVRRNRTLAEREAVPATHKIGTVRGYAQHVIREFSKR
jgi:hypothetical protein